MSQTELFPAPADPLRYPCTYPGLRGYAAPCGARPGQPCRWANPPFGRFHAERRVAAGEPLKSYEERFADAEEAPEEPVEPEADEGDEPEDEGP